MATDIFNSESNPAFLSQYERKLAADIAGAFDANRQATERQQSRYGAPQLSNQEDLWGIGRATALVDNINKQRMTQERIDAANAQEAARLAAAQQRAPVSGYSGPSLQDILNALGTPPNNNTAHNGTNWAQGLAGLASLAGMFGLRPTDLLGLFKGSNTDNSEFGPNGYSPTGPDYGYYPVTPDKQVDNWDLFGNPSQSTLDPNWVDPNSFWLGEW